MARIRGDQQSAAGRAAALGGFRSACVTSHAGDTRRRSWSGRIPLLRAADVSTVPLRERGTVTFKPPACRTLAGCKHRLCRFGSNAVVMSRAAGTDELGN